MSDYTKSISVTELCKVFYCPAQIRVVGGRAADISREQFRGLRLHEETERMIRSHGKAGGEVKRRG